MSLLSPVHSFFNHPTIRKIWVRSRFLWAAVLLGLVVFYRLPQARFFWYGFVIASVGELIQLWCFAALDKKGTLAARGLYAVVRNPMYIGRWLLVIGCVLVLGNIWLLLLTIIGYWFYMVNRVKREEKVLIEIFGKDYEEYCQRVGRFVPKFPIDWKAIPYFNLRLFLRNNGPLNLIGMLLVFALYYWSIFIRH